MRVPWLIHEQAALGAAGLHGAIVAKASSIMAQRGFLAVVRGLAAELMGAAAPEEAKGLAAMLQELDKDWPNMTADAREEAMLRASFAVSDVSTKVAPKVERVFKDRADRIVRDTKKVTLDGFDVPIRPSLSAVDEKVIKHAATSQSLFVTDEYKRRSEAVSVEARRIVAAGMRQGLDQYAIGRELKSSLGDKLEGRSDAYWNVAASIFAARARTYGQLSGFAEAGITSFQFEAILDEDTSVVCRFMHGKVFSVRAAMSRYRKVASSPPEAVRELQPFLAVAEDEDGNETIYYKQGDRRVGVAQVDENAYGQRDVVGSFSKGLSTKRLEGAGITTPPLHGHCRSTLIPVFDDVGGGAEPSPPAAPPGPAPAPKPKAPRPPPKRTAEPEPPVEVFRPPPAGPPDPAGRIPPPPAVPPAPPPMPVVRPGRPAAAVQPPAPAKPVVPPAPRVDGRFAEVVSEVGAKARQAFLAEIDRVGLSPFLERAPLDNFSITKVQPMKGAGGVYIRQNKLKDGEITVTKTVKVTTDTSVVKLTGDRKPGAPWSWPWTVANTAKDDEGFFNRLLVHELGHHVHLHDVDVKGKPTTIIGAAVDKDVRATFRKNRDLRGRSKAITQYGEQNHQEYFAETFTAYTYEREHLRALDPAGLALVERVLRLRGIEMP